jgi:AraC-like DNA-binding protein
MTTGLNHELLGALELRVLAVQRTVVDRTWNFRQVVSPFTRLWVVMAGEATVRHHGQRFRLRAGQMHLVPPFTVHDCSCARRLDHFYLHFSSRLPTGVELFSLLDAQHQLPTPTEAAKLLRRLEAIFPERRLPCLDPSREEYRRHPLVAEQADARVPAVDWFEAGGLLTLLLAPFLRSASWHEGAHARVTQQFLAVQQFIHAQMHRPLLLADLARVAQLHPTYFSDRFLALTGVRPLEYLMQRRLERAQFLLLTTRVPVKQVAAEVGIADAAYFTRAFTRRCGISPSAYRQSHAG